MYLRQGVPSGKGAVQLKGTNVEKCSFVTIAAAVSTTGLYDLGRERMGYAFVQRIEIIKNNSQQSCRRMERYPLSTVSNGLDVRTVFCRRVILGLVREELALRSSMVCAKPNRRKKTYKEPKSIQGIPMMSSVSTPYEPSNE